MAGFVFAAAFATISGGVATIQKQQNVASIVKNATGQFTVNFTNPLPTVNYGVLADCRMPNNAGSDSAAVCGPNRDTSSGHNAYSTTQLDLFCQEGISGATDPINLSLIVFDPGTSASGIQAAGLFTVAGSACTVVSSTGIGSVIYKSTGVYEIDWSPTLARSDYSLFGGAQLPGASGALSGTTLNAGVSPNNLHTTSAFSQAGMSSALTAATEVLSSASLVIDCASPPTGILAAARLSYNGNGVPATIARSFNIGSTLGNNGTPAGTLNVNMTFSSALADANYGVICAGTGSSGSNAGKGYAKFYTGGGSSNYSNTDLTLSIFGSSPIDVIVFDPTQLAFANPPALLGQAWL